MTSVGFVLEHIGRAMRLPGLVAIWSALAPVSAMADTPSPREAASALWEHVQTVCPSEAKRYDAHFPAAIQTELENRQFKSGVKHWPLTAEHTQIIIYVLVQAEQTLAVASYDADWEKGSESSTAMANAARKARAATDFATCLMPVGPRFSHAVEPEIPQLASLVTEAVTCRQWYQYSNRLSDLEELELTRSERQRLRAETFAETVGSCKTD